MSSRGPADTLLLEPVRRFAQRTGRGLGPIGNCQPLEEFARFLVGHISPIAAGERVYDRTSYGIAPAKHGT